MSRPVTVHTHVGSDARVIWFDKSALNTPPCVHHAAFMAPHACTAYDAQCVLCPVHCTSSISVHASTLHARTRAHTHTEVCCTVPCSSLICSRTRVTMAAAVFSSIRACVRVRAHGAYMGACVDFNPIFIWGLHVSEVTYLIICDVMHSDKLCAMYIDM